MLRALRERHPSLHVQAFTAVEIDYFSQITGLPLGETIRQLKEAGLGPLPGGGAEIFAPAVRERICPEKVFKFRGLKIGEAKAGTMDAPKAPVSKKRRKAARD